MASPTPRVARPEVRDADSLPSDRPCRGIDRVLHARDDPAAAAEQDKIFVTDTDVDADAEGSKRSNPIFILDSAASCHVATDKWLFRRLNVAPAPESRPTVCCADGTLLPVAGTGTVASENFHLPDVFYIPGLVPGKILVSVSQLAKLGYDVMFGGGQCRVMDRTGDKLVGQGPLQRDDGFYYRLEFLKIPLDEAAADGTEFLKIPLEEAAADGTDSKVV